MAEVLAHPDRENIDLLPLSWLVERWCKMSWEDGVQLETPRGRRLNLACWHRMPYLAPDQVRKVFDDLPTASVRGRSGAKAGDNVAAAAVSLRPHACAARCPPPTPVMSPEALDTSWQRERLKECLSHLRDSFSKREWQNA